MRRLLRQRQMGSSHREIQPLLTKHTTPFGIRRMSSPQQSQEFIIPTFNTLPIPVLYQIFDNTDISGIVSIMTVTRYLREVAQRWITTQVNRSFRNDLSHVEITYLRGQSGNTRNPKSCNEGQRFLLEPYRVPRTTSTRPQVVRNDYQIPHIAFFFVQLGFAEASWDSSYDLPGSTEDLPGAYNNLRVVQQRGRRMILEAKCMYHGDPAAREIFRREIYCLLFWYQDPSFTPAGHWTLEWIEISLPELYNFHTWWL